MFRTFTLFFLLGLMVSCSSYENSRTISSYEEESEHHKHPRYELRAK